MVPMAAKQCRDWYSEASQPGKKKGVWVGWRKAFKGIEVCTVMFSWYQKLGMWKKHPSKRHSRCQGSEAARLSFTVPVAEPGVSHYIRNKPQAGVSPHEIPRHSGFKSSNVPDNPTFLGGLAEINTVSFIPS